LRSPVIVIELVQKEERYQCLCQKPTGIFSRIVKIWSVRPF